MGDPIRYEVKPITNADGVEGFAVDGFVPAIRFAVVREEWVAEEIARLYRERAAESAAPNDQGSGEDA